MPRAVANTLLPAARPASTIARPRPRELPVTNHTCAIHPPVYRSQPLGYSIEASRTQDWMHDGYTNGLVSYGGNRGIFRPQDDSQNRGQATRSLFTSRLLVTYRISVSALAITHSPRSADF